MTYQQRKRAGLCPSAGCDRKPTDHVYCDWHVKYNRAARLRSEKKNGPVLHGPPAPRTNRRRQTSDSDVLSILRKIPGVTAGRYGWPDLWAIHEGQARFFEIKGPGDSLREDQKKCHAALDLAGVRVEIISPETAWMFYGKERRNRSQPVVLERRRPEVPVKDEK